jgi:NAD dependent epimerase/dehydratase
METLQGKAVLVTGAGGFIGSHLAERLVREGAQVRALVRYTSRGDAGFLSILPEDVRSQVSVCHGDVRDIKTVREAMQGVQFVFHLAALVGIPYSYVHPQEVIETNVVGTANVLLSARDNDDLQRVLLTSTSEVYGTACYVPIDEAHPLQPQSPYSATKIAADALGISFHRSFEMPVVLVRPFNAYGPRQSMRAVIPTIIVQALTRDKVMLGALQPTRDFTYVTDTARGFIQAAIAPRAVGQAINIGTGREISIGDLARRIVELTGSDAPVVQDPQRLRPAGSEVERLCASNALAQELLGWRPQVSLDEGLRRTIDWVRGSLDIYRPDEYVV